MIFKELCIYFKKYKFITSIIYLQITLFLILLGAFYSFFDALNYNEDGMKDIYEGKAVYQLIDNYCEGDKFEEFISHPDALERIRDFYVGLDTADHFKYLAISDQRIGINKKNIPQIMSAGYEQGKEYPDSKINGQTYKFIKSVQLNQQAFNFFKLDVSHGRIWTNEDFKDQGNTIPVLLGDSYKNVYEIGDELNISYIGKEINAKVIGFLKSNSKIFYNEDTEFYLDRYILLPFFKYNDPVSKEDSNFQFFSYYMLINGYVVTDNETPKIRNMMEEIEVLSQITSFKEYSFIGANPHLKQYHCLMMTIQENSKLVKCFFMISTGLNLFLLSLLLYLQQKRRLSSYAIHYMQGATKFSIIRQQWLEISIIMLLSFITYFIILDQIFKLGNYKLHGILFMLLFIMSLILSCISSYQLLHRPLVYYLSNNEEMGDRIC
ncbi:hypothetical protein [Anaerophilus nitritogenes]|uniref:hypothetical protein n=1 Tax=Anaerophilus nitritogenes TaxID=2498136 RepID=UPI00101D5BA2|nr:hypothetical protein [Anaerophilus nitritogenes]